jgi:parallel beta-helix repeat protein
MRLAQRKRLTAIITGLLVFFAAASSHAQTGPSYYYVAPGGNDSNPGTESLPWKTLTKAASTATANVTVFIKQGTYRERLVPVNSGTPEGPIIFTSYPGDSVTITGVGMTPPTGWWAGLIWIQGLKYIKISGLRVTNSVNIGIDVENSSHITIEKNYVDSTYSSGMKVYASDNIVIDANEVVRGCIGSDLEECISVATTNLLEIKNNRVHDGRSIGIDVKYGSTNAIVTKNEVYNQNGGIGIYIEAWTLHEFNIDVFDNFSHDNGIGFAVTSEMGGLIEAVSVHHNVAYRNQQRGIAVVGWGGGQTHPVRSIKVYENTVYENGFGIEIGGYSGTTLDSIGVFNNLIYRNKNAGIRITRYDGPSGEYALRNVSIISNTIYANGTVGNGWDADNGGMNLFNISPVNMLIRNNILSNNAVCTIYVESDVPAGSVTIDYNFFDGFRHFRNETPGTNAVYGSPLFVDTLRNDYHLQAASPCIDKGHPNQEYNDPADPKKPSYAMYPAQGTVRNDMGAYGGPYASSLDTMVVAAPSVPTLTSPANGATGVPTTLLLSWNGAWEATSHRLQVSTSPGFSPLIIDQSGITGTSYGIRGFANNTRYYWRVSATNAGGTSSYSNTWSFTTIVPGPAAPTLASPSNGATRVSNSPMLSWNASLGATSYALQVSTSADFSSLVVNQSGIVGTWNVVSLSNNTTYYWRVNATNVAGTSGWSTAWSFTTIVAAPSAPILTSPANGATGVSTSPTLRWNASAGTKSYRLQISKNETFSAIVFDSSGIADTSYVSLRLLSRTTHYWRVNATNDAGISGWSTAWNFTTMVVSSLQQIGGVIPSEYSLIQNYPNPFNPSTSIEFGVPRGGHVSLKVYDLLGKEVATLVSERVSAGAYRVNWVASGVASGIYYYRFESGKFAVTKRLVVLR